MSFSATLWTWPWLSETAAFLPGVKGSQAPGPFVALPACQTNGHWTIPIIQAQHLRDQQSPWVSSLAAWTLQIPTATCLPPTPKIPPPPAAKTKNESPTDVRWE